MLRHFPVSIQRPAVAAALFAASLGITTAGELKVDINRDSKNLDSVTETGYTKWSQDSTGAAASGTAAVSKTFTSATGETITVTFAQTPTSAAQGGTGLLSNWYQTGAQGTAKLVSDGITVAPANLAGGGEISMTITGLSAGTHTLLTYHNAWDALTAGSLGVFDVWVNGAPVIEDLQPTIRAATNTAAPIAYVTFAVDGPSDVTSILFTADVAASPSATIHNVMINGFEIDTPNSTRIANTPSPADADEHVDADLGSVTLSWATATAGTAVAHDVYFGTSEAALRAATKASPEYVGRQTSTSHAVSGLVGSGTYYWRVDEVDSVGNATQGTVWYFRPRQLAFPDAEGYGRFARGGRGGKVVEVTSLDDYDPAGTPEPGTLRYAIEQETGPRTIVFTVSGLITLTSRLTLNAPYVTIAGQTAPGKGICLREYTMGLSGGVDDIVRFVRSRPGNISGTTIDGMGMSGSNHCIMDHCSISWSIDEAFSSRTAKNITLQRTLVSEALNVAGHQNYPAGTAHGYAASIGGDVGSFHHNLLAHCYGRNWSLAGGLDSAGYFAGRLDITNNVVYNWGHRATDGGAMEVNFVGNYYKPGASTDFFYALNAQYDNFPGMQRYYFAGNVMPGHFTEANETAGYTETASNGGSLPSYENFVSTPFFVSYVTTQTATAAYKSVLSDVGCSEPRLDDHDVRVITETRNGTYTYTGSVSGKPGLPDTQDDVGGWEDYPFATRPADWDSDHDGMPDWWETMHGLDPHSAIGDFSESNADPEGDGFTQLEDYLNWMAAPHVATSTDLPVDVDLSPLSAGYSASPAFTVDATTGGSAQLIEDGHTVEFMPAAGSNGLGSFTFTVTDSAGDSTTRTVGIRTLPDPELRLTIASPGKPPGLALFSTNGTACRIQYSTDLVNWTDWTTVTATGGEDLLEPPAELAALPRVFFRAVR